MGHASEKVGYGREMLPSIRKGLILEALSGSQATGRSLCHVGAVSETPVPCLSEGGHCVSIYVGGTLCFCGLQAAKDTA